MSNDLILTAGGDYHGDVGTLGGVDMPAIDWEKFKT